MNYKQIVLNDGESIYLEDKQLDHSHEGPVQVSAYNRINKGQFNLAEEAAKIGRFLKELRKGILDELPGQMPNQVEFEVGLGFDHSIGCVVVGSTMNAQVCLKLVWENKDGDE